MRSLLLALPFALLPGFVQAAEHHDHGHDHSHDSLSAHEHGAAELDAALDGATLEIELRSPAMNLVGFEHAPRSDADKAKIAGARKQLEQPDSLFGLTPAAGCTLAKTELESPLFEGGHSHEHEHEHEHEHGEHGHEAHAKDEHAEADHGSANAQASGHDEHDHDHRPGSLDAHLWLLPANAVVIAEGMAKDMSKADPDNAQRYDANLAAFKQRLAALDERLGKRLSETRSKPFFVFHEAYEYFEAAYGIKHTGVFSAGGEAQPGARHVAAMRERLEQAGPSCVFYEPPTRPRLADSLTRGLPAKVAELDALGYGIDATAGGYEQLIDDLGSSLAGCLESL